MNAISRMTTAGALPICFSLDAVIAFIQSGTATSPKTKIVLAGASSRIEISFPFTEFVRLHTKYKEGLIDMQDFDKDADGRPITGLLKFYL
jgi:hypothetical protein